MTSATGFEKLFEICRIGGMRVRNRIVFPPISTNFGSKDGRVTEQMKDYYEERARGGCGLVIVETFCVDFPVGRGTIGEPRADDDLSIQGLTELAEAMHKHGAMAAVQLHHAGRDAHVHITGLQPVAPSPLAALGGETPRELSPGEIKQLVENFAQAGERVKKAGFDGVEIHAAAGYLVASFLSAGSNKRTDDYGGSLENRTRILVEIIRALKERLGREYPVWCRLNGMEYGLDGGVTAEESRDIARIAEKAGSDAIHLHMLGVGSYGLAAFPSTPGGLVQFAENWKKVVTVPVIAVGRLDPVTAEMVLQEGKADLISIGRGLIADPELPHKIAEGRLEDIRPCLACNKCGEMVVYLSKGMRCSTNAAVGREDKRKITPSPTRKRVLVVGGGPAGMEYARISALRGHEVTLFEKTGTLGGQLRLAAVPPDKRDKIEPLTNYLSAQMRNPGIKVRLNTEANKASIQEMRPDVVVVATGAEPSVPDIPGVNGPNVVMAEDILAGKARVGDVVVIVGGELVGCETADLLASQGKKVAVVRRGPRMAVKMSLGARGALLRSLRSRNVTLMPGIKEYLEITNGGLNMIDGNGQRLSLSADTVVIAAGARPNVSLFKDLEGQTFTKYLIGDASEPRNIMDAMEDVARVAYDL